jgi:aldose 1-epimerase
LSQQLIELEHGNVKALINPIGAALIGLSFDNLSVIEQPAKAGVQVFHGSTLAPWCNRTKAGSWLDQAGIKRQLPINEIAKNNALHGLVFDRAFEISLGQPHRVVLETLIEPTDGYPFELKLSIGYRLDENGLTCDFEVRNLGSNEAPFALAFHPYFRLSGFDTGDLRILATAQQYYLQDENQIPTGLATVAGANQDLRSGKKVRGAGLDDYYTDLKFESGLAETKLLAPDGSGIAIWQQQIFKHLVVFTTDGFPGADGSVSAVAIEPSTSAADALNNKDDLLWVLPEQTLSGSWGVSLA